MIRLGLIGYPLGHSLSPRIHEAALRSCGLEGSYSVFPIPPNDQKGLKNLLELVRNRDITGLNVTIPHKQNVIPFLDDLTPTAKSIGAVNTIYMRENRLMGDNTDASGFLVDLKRFLTRETCFDSAQHRLRHRELKAFVLGAGGSARAVVYALLNDGWEVLISARRLEQAGQLVDALTNHQFSQNSLMGPITVLSLSDMEPTFTNLQSQISNLSLIVNTTPVGMTPNIDQSPWPENLPFPPRAAIYDLVYNPGETKLVIDARSQGLHATTGLGMLIEQAALAFQIWTDRKPSRESMFEVVNQTVN
jgi:shikimate dehydrogenase